MTAIDQLIAAGGNLNLYDVQDPGRLRYVRNPSHWLRAFNLEGVSPWNSYDGPRRGGVLIGRRHALFACHYPISVGATVHFVGRTPAKVWAPNVVKVVSHPLWKGAPYYFDLLLAELDDAAPGWIQRMPIVTVQTLTKGRPRLQSSLFKGSEEYALAGLPVIGMDQEEKALLFEGALAVFSDARQLGYSSGRMSTLLIDWPSSTDWAEYAEPMVGGDSGNPMFTLCGKQLGLLSLFTGASRGTIVGAEREWIESVVPDAKWM